MSEDLIRLKDVVKSYRTGENQVTALQKISLTIRAGEFTSIAGPSGSGKTTLLNLIGCLDSLDAGELTIENQAVSNLNRKQLAAFRRHRLGFIFQSYNLIPVLTAFENVALPLELLGVGKDEVGERVSTLLGEVGLQGLENRRPSALSGGQQQRVAVARALVKKPALVLADEPTANLDSKTGESVLDLMRAMNEKTGTTFLFSTHDPMVMDRARRLLLLHDGRVVKDEER